MNKFITAIAGSADGIKLVRAQNTAQAAKLAQTSLINEKSKIVQSVQAQLTNALDIGPDDSTSLRPVGANWNADAWVNEIQTLKFSLKKAQEQLDIAQATYTEWFAESAAPAPTV